MRVERRDASRGSCWMATVDIWGSWRGHLKERVFSRGLQFATGVERNQRKNTMQWWYQKISNWTTKKIPHQTGATWLLLDQYWFSTPVPPYIHWVNQTFSATDVDEESSSSSCPWLCIPGVLFLNVRTVCSSLARLSAISDHCRPLNRLRRKQILFLADEKSLGTVW